MTSRGYVTAGEGSDSQAAHRGVRATLCLPVRTALLRDVVHEERGWKDRRAPSAKSLELVEDLCRNLMRC